MAKEMGWFCPSALVAVLVGMRYFQLHLLADARLAGEQSLARKWMGWWLLVWVVAYIFIYAFQLPAKGFLDSPWVRGIGIGIVVAAASWLVMALNGGPTVSNAHLAISVGGGLGLVMALNTSGVVCRGPKKIITVGRSNAV